MNKESRIKENNKALYSSFLIPYSGKTNGFTLIELLVVISIIAILATLLVANFNSARERGRDAQRKSDLKNILTALRLFYNDKNVYPASNVNGQIVGCGVTGSYTACTWGGSWTADGTTYMPVLPKDPLSSQNYFYTLGADTDTYTLYACLENKSDDKGVPVATTVCESGVKFELSQ